MPAREIGLLAVEIIKKIPLLAAGIAASAVQYANVAVLWTGPDPVN